MAYTEDTPMDALLAGMAVVDAEACHEFAQRQHLAGHGADLATAAALVHELAFAAQLDRPDELMAWKDPEAFEPVDTTMLAELLQAASDNARQTARDLITNQTFADITALSSIASYLGQSCEQLRRFDGQRPHPQRSLF